MNTLAGAAEAAAVLTQRILRLQIPLGLLGFEQIKEYSLITIPGSEPFRWLQVADDASLAFVVVPPFDVFPTYQPDIPRDDVEFLQLSSASDAAVFNIVTLHGKGAATVNLKGPVVVNVNTLRAKQVILANASEYALQEPLPISE